MLLLLPSHHSLNQKMVRGTGKEKKKQLDLSTLEAQKWNPERWSLAGKITASITLCSIELTCWILATDSKCLKKDPDKTHNKWDETRKRRWRTRENYTKMSWRCTISPAWEDPPSSRGDMQVKISSKKSSVQEGKNPHIVIRLYLLDAAGTC